MADWSPAFIVAQYLEAEGVLGDPVATSLNWPLYISHLPDRDSVPNNAAAIFDSDGIKDGRLMAGHSVLHHGFQIMFRSVAHQDGWNKAVAVSQALEDIHNESVVIGADTFVIAAVSMRGTPLFLGLEEGTRRRNLFTVNFTVTIRGE